MTDVEAAYFVTPVLKHWSHTKKALESQNMLLPHLSWLAGSPTECFCLAGTVDLRLYNQKDNANSCNLFEVSPQKSELPLMHCLALGLILFIPQLHVSSHLILNSAPWGYLFLCECLQLDMLIAAAHGVAGGMPSIFTVSYQRVGS